ncbi:MAG: hypothetical protein ACYC9Q_14160 [Bacillota bacterium]
MAERKMIQCVRTESFDVEMGGRIVRMGDIIDLPEDEVTGPSARTDFKPVEAPKKTRKGEN